jgi:N-acetyl sugar amidotransferase
MDATDSKLKFNLDGICEYCLNFEQNILPNWRKGVENKFYLKNISDQILKNTKNKKYNCIIGISGGVDSSYVTHVAKNIMGLNPLLLHVDAGWNSDIAASNIEKLVSKLGVDLHTEVIDWDEMRDLQLSFFKSGVPHLDTPQDHAFFGSLYNFAKKYKFKYILTGANYSTESTREPLEWHYHATDLKHLLDIQKKFGLVKLKTFPLTDIFRYKIFYKFIHNINIIKPLNYIEYLKEDAINLLKHKYDWTPYAHKHHESRFTSFYESYWLLSRFGFDKRKAHYSSLISSNQMSRSKALDMISKPVLKDHQISLEFEYMSSKLDISNQQLKKFYLLPKKNYNDYKNNASLIRMGTSLSTFLGINNTLIR